MSSYNPSRSPRHTHNTDNSFGVYKKARSQELSDLTEALRQTTEGHSPIAVPYVFPNQPKSPRSSHAEVRLTRKDDMFRNQRVLAGVTRRAIYGELDQDKTGIFETDEDLVITGVREVPTPGGRGKVILAEFDPDSALKLINQRRSIGEAAARAGKVSFETLDWSLECPELILASIPGGLLRDPIHAQTYQEAKAHTQQPFNITLAPGKKLPRV